LDGATSLQLAEALLKKGDTPTALLLETLGAESQEVQRLNSLLKDYRSFARPLHLNLEPTDLRRESIQRITNLMGENRSRCAQRCESLVLAQSFLVLLALRNIANHLRKTIQFSRLVMERRNQNTRPELGTVLAHA